MTTESRRTELRACTPEGDAGSDESKAEGTSAERGNSCVNGLGSTGAQLVVKHGSDLVGQKLIYQLTHKIITVVCTDTELNVCVVVEESHSSHTLQAQLTSQESWLKLHLLVGDVHSFKEYEFKM